MYRLATKFLQAPFSRVAKLNRCSLRSSAKYTSVTRNYAEANRGASVKLQIRTMRSDSWKAGDQHQLMDSDYCILVDLQDNVIGSETKRKTHIFQNGRPAPLHRAFSVFHFDDQGRLLLQQRAGSKITFPLCWTNTCCSHPLHFDHETYSETDTPADVASGLVPGAKRAAVRKLQHELGITCSKEVMDSMRFLTRLYYCAPQPADKDGVVWGEHEMDYILFSRGHVDIKADPDEVGDYRWVRYFFVFFFSHLCVNVLR